MLLERYGKRPEAMSKEDHDFLVSKNKKPEECWNGGFKRCSWSNYMIRILVEMHDGRSHNVEPPRRHLVALEKTRIGNKCQPKKPGVLYMDSVTLYLDCECGGVIGLRIQYKELASAWKLPLEEKWKACAVDDSNKRLYAVSHTCDFSRLDTERLGGPNACRECYHMSYETPNRNSLRLHHSSGSIKCNYELEGHARCINEGVKLAHPASRPPPLAVVLANSRLDQLVDPTRPNSDHHPRNRLEAWKAEIMNGIIADPTVIAPIAKLHEDIELPAFDVFVEEDDKRIYRSVQACGLLIADEREAFEQARTTITPALKRTRKVPVWTTDVEVLLWQLTTSQPSRLMMLFG